MKIMINMPDIKEESLKEAFREIIRQTNMALEEIDEKIKKLKGSDVDV